MFSVIIPTMWKYEPFFENITKLIFVDCITEIIIINNDPSKKPNHSCFEHPKISIHTPKENLYVSPSWNYGASVARNNWLCFIGDDLNFDTRLFYKVRDFIFDNQLEMTKIGMIGLLTPYHNDQSYDKFYTDGEIDILSSVDSDPEKRPSNVGMGNLFFVKKEDWKDIPSQIKIFHGEVLQWNRIQKYKTNYMITNCFAETPWHVTWKSLAEDPNFATTFSQIQIEDQKSAELMHFTFD